MNFIFLKKKNLGRKSSYMELKNELFQLFVWEIPQPRSGLCHNLFY